ncbi:hypothetical protein F511_08880 [Dorcoceras hygrometricum]|uniref:Uncharacterized protein n=1 Tax=Dorcoceras hygrometricum TaxID=472368 RepID=A0A2Z7CCA7_9LAMI|nr:hypothetical protein F511_08880 [Dorcoceras hygrometricum]
MVKRLATSPHDTLGITDSACKNQLVVVSVQYGPFNPYIPIGSTTIGKSRVTIDPIAMHTSWRSNSDIASVISIGYPRMSASGESSTTMHRLLHASGSHPIPTPYDPNTCVTLNGSGIQLAMGPQPLWLWNHNSGLAHRIMVRASSNIAHDPLGITDSACKNQLVVVSVQYGPFNPYIPIRSTTIGKSRVVKDQIAMHTSWRSNSDIASVTRTIHVMSASGEYHQVTIYLHAQNITIFPTNEHDFTFSHETCAIPSETVQRARLTSFARDLSRFSAKFLRALQAVVFFFFPGCAFDYNDSSFKIFGCATADT